MEKNRYGYQEDPYGDGDIPEIDLPQDEMDEEEIKLPRNKDHIDIISEELPFHYFTGGR